MSSSDSSEDEEELKKINEAIIPNDLLFTLTSSIPTIRTETSEYEKKSETRCTKSSSEKSHLDRLAAKFKRADRKIDPELLKLKSNRPDKSTENDESLYHATTPGFRSHIEKHLSQMLDSEIKANVRDSVWKKLSPKKEKKQSGIKLFSDVNTLCDGTLDTQQQQMVQLAKIPPKIRPRKHKLNSSSSESSDDEDKINACIFTVDDIMHENKLLDNLSKSGVELSNTDVKRDGSDSHNFDKKDENEGEKSSETLKREKKRRRSENGNDHIQEADESKEKMSSVKKKKKKKSQESSNDKQVIHHNQEDLPIKKRKEK